MYRKLSLNHKLTLSLFVVGIAWAMFPATFLGQSSTTQAPPTDFSALPGAGVNRGGEDAQQLIGELPGATGADSARPRVGLKALFQVGQGSRDGHISIQAVIQPGWHVYSTTQPQGGPLRTTVAVVEAPQYRVVGDFGADRDPEVHNDPVFPGVPIEEHTEQVIWSAPIRLADGVEPKTLQIHATVKGQVCGPGGTCEMLNESVVAQFAGYQQAETAAAVFKDPNEHIQITGHLEPKVVAPGETVELVLTATLPGDWHVYRWAAIDPKKISKPTLIALRKVNGWSYGPAQASVKPKEEETGLDDEPVLYLHEGTVSWTVPIQVPKSAEVGLYPLLGLMGYQTCTPSACDLPSGVEFTAELAVGKQVVKGQVPLAFKPSNYGAAAKEAANAALKKPKAVQKEAATTGNRFDRLSLASVLGLAFLAGLILNVMPCVLPVIGLKIMSFVHQAGGSRGEILTLNLWFSLGMLTVFWILAAAAAFAGHTWGAHFSNTPFLIVMIGLVFVFGLSFLGVWEIPIPGFVGSGSMQGAAEREGAVGAFSKGMLSTVLATPCAGPLIGPAVGWAVKQPTSLTFLAFTFIGLGMASPYLLIGLFPRLVNSLPKPGAWMDTFKQVMGFVLMATVIFLFTSVPSQYVVATLILLLGLAVACWLIGRTPLTAEPRQKLGAWIASAAIVAVSFWLGFVAISQTMDWQPFSRVALREHLDRGAIVMVDFTANW